jgi:ATP/maltotriose-dependent transcriptional regulator MalT
MWRESRVLRGSLAQRTTATATAEIGRLREVGDEHDNWTQALWRQVQARVDATRGDHTDAERLAREAVELWEPDMLYMQGDALCDLAEVLEAAGRGDEAAETLEQALERYERTKNLAMVAQVRSRLEGLRAGVAAASASSGIKPS